MRSIIILVALAATACGGPVDSDNDSSQPEVKAADTVFDPLVDNLDKAKKLNDVVLQHKDDMDDRLQDMEEGADDSP